MQHARVERSTTHISVTHAREHIHIHTHTHMTIRLRTRLEPPKQCQVRFIFHFFQRILAGQQFFLICELIFLCSYSFHFFLNFFSGYAVTVSKFSELFNYAVTVFLPELILHKYSVEGYTYTYTYTHKYTQSLDKAADVCPSGSFSTRWSMSPLCRLGGGPDSAGRGVPLLQFSDKVDVPIVVTDRCSEVPQVQFFRLWTSL